MAPKKDKGQAKGGPGPPPQAAAAAQQQPTDLCVLCSARIDASTDDRFEGAPTGVRCRAVRAPGGPAVIAVAREQPRDVSERAGSRQPADCGPAPPPPLAGAVQFASHRRRCPSCPALAVTCNLCGQASMHYDCAVSYLEKCLPAMFSNSSAQKRYAVRR